MQSVSRVVEESAQPTAVIVGATRAQLRRYAPILEGAGYQLAVIEVPGDVPTNTSAQQAALMIFNTSVGETDILLAYRSLPRRAPLVLLDGETALPRDGFERHQRVPYGPEEFAWLLRRLASAGRDAPIDTRPAPDVPRVTDAPAPTAPAPQPPPPIERPAPAMPPPSSDAGVPRDVRGRADDTWLEERTPGQRVVDAPLPQKEPAASEVAPEAVRWRRPESAREVAADSIPEMTRVPVARPARVLEEPRREVRPRRPWPAVLLLVTLLLLILAIGTWFLRRDTTVGSASEARVSPTAASVAVGETPPPTTTGTDQATTVPVAVSTTAPNAVSTEPISGPDLIAQIVGIVPAQPAAGAAVNIQVQVQNIGTGATTEPFWVDLYLSPQATPTVNRSWSDLSAYGATWLVEGLEAGESRVLETIQADPTRSNLLRFPTAGPQEIYVLVDSFAPQATGTVGELDESNNLSGPFQFTVGLE